MSVWWWCVVVVVVWWWCGVVVVARRRRDCRLAIDDDEAACRGGVWVWVWWWWSWVVVAGGVVVAWVGGLVSSCGPVLTDEDCDADLGNNRRPRCQVTTGETR